MKHETGLLTLLWRHFEKGVLALSASWLTLVALGAVSGDTAAAAEVPELAEQVQRHLSDGVTVPEPVAPAWTLLPPDEAARLAATAELPEWSLHRRPGLVVYVDPRLEQVTKARHFPPLNLRVSSDQERRDRIELNWELSRENSSFLVIDFQVQRQTGEGPWEVLAESFGVETRFVDRDVQPQTPYRYRVLSRARLDPEDPALPVNAQLAHPERVGEIVAAQTLQPLFRVVPLLAEDPVAGRPLGMLRQVQVFRWTSGEWARALFLDVAPGEPIGARKQVRLSGRRVEVDFSTGARLKSARIEAAQIPGADPGTTKSRAVAVIVWPDGREQEVRAP